MPTISMFYGILIRMFYDDHNPPHIHALYNEYETVYDFDGNLIDGEKLPSKQHKLVLAWIEIHKEELTANWKLAQYGEAMFKIDPLK